MRNVKQTAATELKIKEVADLILKGKTRSQITDFCKEHYDIGQCRTDLLRAEAYKYIEENCKLEKTVVKEVNHSRLMQIYDKAIAAENYNLALKVIDILNRMFTIYTDKQEVDLKISDYTFKFAQ